MKATPETLVKILDLLCGNAVIRQVCRIANVGESTFWEWYARSRKSDPLFEVEWMGVRQQWAEHLKVARDIFLAHLEASFIDRMERGHDEPIFWQGKPSWQLDHRFEKWSDEEMTNLGYSLEERYLHDPRTGARLQHVIHHPPPIAGVTATLAADSKKWQTKSDLNVTGKVALGVSVVGRQTKVVDVTPKPALAPPVESNLSNEVAATLTPAEPVQRISEAPMAEDFSTGAEIPVEQPDRVTSSPFYKPPPEGRKKQPEGMIKMFAAEAATDDPPETVGGDEAKPADAPATAPRVDVEQLVPVREAKRRIHDGLHPRNAIERQIMNALQLNLSPEARERRLRELTGGQHSDDGRQEDIGAGARPSGLPVRVV